MYRIFKIIIINILLLILLFAVFETLVFYSYKKSKPFLKYAIKLESYKDSWKHSYPREPEGLIYKKRPIMLAGCSYIYGVLLNKTPQYKLSELTKRPVFNYALPGKGMQHSLYIIKNQLYDSRMHNPEYFIYVMIDDHIRRMYMPATEDDKAGQPVFKIDKKGRITLRKDNYHIYRNFYTYYFITNILYSKYYKNRQDLSKRYVFAYFREMNRLLKEQFPDIKFILLIYDDKDTFGINFKKLEKDGIIVYQTKELTGIELQNIKWRISDKDPHPTEAAWDVIIPALVNKLNIE